MKASQFQAVYSCECSRSYPFNKLSYCLQCHAFKCLLCCQLEITSYFCATTLQNVTASDAMSDILRGKSDKAFHCAQCHTICQISVEEGEPPSYYLRCSYCDWNSKDSFVAPGAPELLKKLLEAESAEQTEFRQFCERFKAGVKEEKDAQAKRRQSERFKRTAHLLSMTPAKAKLFPSLSQAMSPSISPKKKISAVLDFGGDSNAAESTEEDEGDVLVPMGAFKLSHLEAQLSKKQKQLSESNSGERMQLVDGLAAIGQPEGKPAKIERQELLSMTSRHCGKCDKLLVKADTSPAAATEFKRLHLSYHFAPEFKLIALKDGVAHLGVYNPLRAEISLMISEGDARDCRWALGKPLAMDLKPLGVAVPTPVALSVVQGNPQGQYLMHFKVNMEYEYSLGNQSAEFTVKFRVRPK